MLTIIIPAYNEESIIQNTIDKIYYWSSKVNLEINLIVVNNNSTDSTEEILKLNKRKLNFFNYLNEFKQGKGFAIKKGFEVSTSKILILDADLSVSIDQFRLEWLECEDVLISGSRFSGKVIGTPQIRNLTGKVFSKIVKNFFSLPIEDTQCGFKFISIKDPIELTKKLNIGNFAYDIDLILTLNSMGIKLVNVPVTYIHNNNSSVHIFSDSIKMLISLIKIKKKFS